MKIWKYENHYFTYQHNILPNNNKSPHPCSELLDLSHKFLLLNQVNDSRPISKGLQIIKVMHNPIGFGLGYPGIKRRGIVGFPPLKREHLLQLCVLEGFQPEGLLLHDMLVDPDVFGSGSFHEDGGADRFLGGQLGFVLLADFYELLLGRGGFV